MSNTDRIAQILRDRLPLHLTAGGYVGVPELAAAIEAELHPLIETVEQLDALPVRSVVRDEDGDIHEQDDCGYWRSPRYPSILDAVTLPARVLYTPEADR
ncbi:hypothetical protein [Mycobacterium sp. CnD-18-1]|uniref:hypothetical protein n=1 Tax=Mycobacterium sp. CnD-18-1 TaxID=2917744 RepID=UPI001EF1660A|nr:hypothetical protein [Mycobacterium sp. CnD-18-1]MCG7610362.1 hypothetical protein [Mycobacterium sp. CnD-18-1]